MKSYALRGFWFLVTIFTILVSCQSESERQLIAYTNYNDDAQIWIMSSDGTQAEPAVDLDFSTTGLEWSPDGTQMAFTTYTSSGRTSVWVARSDGSEPRQVSEEFDYIRSVWLNDDVLLTRVITESHPSNISPGYDDYTNYTFDLQSNTMRMYSKGPEEVIPVPPGSRWLAMNGLLGLALHDLDGNTWLLSPWLVPTSAQAFDVSPSGEAIIVCHASAVGEHVPGLYKVVLEQNGTSEPNLVYPMDVCVCARWSPDGRYVALLDNQDVLHVLDAVSLSLLKDFDIGPLTNSFFIWSPDSKFVAVSRHYGEPGPGPKEIARVDVETGEIVRLTDNESVEYLTDWVILPSR